MSQLKSFRELKVYQKLKDLHVEIHDETMSFPKFELYELGSQARRSSNAAPAILAEGWGSRHTNIYIEAINRALGEVRETQHHLEIAKEKKYITEQRFNDLDTRYDECGRMLEGLHQALSEWRDTTRTGKVVREEFAPYGSEKGSFKWNEAVEVTLHFEENFHA
ncbi:MAG: four helix bundle protein [Verrucomicrobia bacterium]|nr:four helix bundle protein [Verrucomicrobiota bacterium]MBU1908824.1 four helix bundle protein [Verrucomicrobiota bacterium]